MLEKGLWHHTLSTPEMLEDRGCKAMPIDIWGLGFVIYSTVTECMSYDTTTTADLLWLNTASKRHKSYKVSILLAVDPGYRMDIYQLLGQRRLWDCHWRPQPGSVENISGIPVTTIMETMWSTGFIQELVSSIWDHSF